MKHPMIHTLAMLFLALVAPSVPLAAQEKKIPVPDQAAQDKAFKLVLDIFGDDLNQAKTPALRSKLAATLLAQGKEVKDDPATRYVCYREARDLAAKGADANLALSVIDEINRSYEIDAVLLKAETLRSVVANTTEKESGLALVDLIKPLLHEAVEMDNYQAAQLLGEAAVDAAKISRNINLVTDMRKRIEEIKAIEKNFSKVSEYEKRVLKNPNDGAAHLELAKYYGYQKKRWEKALPHLARCSDLSLVQLAKQDLGQPKDVKEQLTLADGWWERASKEQNPAKLALQIRAAYWYDKTLPTLTGLNRTKAQKRIDLVQDQLSGSSVSPQPVAGPVGEFKKFEGHTDEIKGVALSADGRYAASAGGRDQTVRVWDLTTGKEAYVLKGHTKEVWAIAFHPNSRYVFSASWDATVRMWDFKAQQDKEVKRFNHPKDVNSVVLSRDGNHMLTGCDDKHVYYWNVSTGEEIRKFSGHVDFVYTVAFAPDGRHIASGGLDKTVRVYDLNSGERLKTFEGHNESVTNVAFTSDSRYVLSSAGEPFVRVWDTTSGKEARRIEGDAKERHTGRILALAISPDGRRLVTGGDDRVIKLWDVVSGKLQHTFTGHGETITCLAFSNDGRRIVSGSYDRSVRVWNLPGR